MRTEKLALLVLAFASISISANAQLASKTDSLNGRPYYNATFLVEDPQVDGDILNDPIWQQVPAVDQLIQSQPNFGMPAS